MAGDNSIGPEIPADVPATWIAWQPLNRKAGKVQPEMTRTNLRDRGNLVDFATLKQKLIKELPAFREFRPKTSLFC